MTKKELNNLYFEWMYQLIFREKGMTLNGLSYWKLFDYLDSIDFIFSIPMDSNRASDGIDLRYRFGYENHYSNPMIASLIDDRPCSVLEMMVALSMRCEESIMDNPDIETSVYEWFWLMIENLGLDNMDDEHFSEHYVSRIISRLLNREYSRNGKGGLFTIRNCKYDLRSIEIWNQMCWYLDEILEKGE